MKAHRRAKGLLMLLAVFGMFCSVSIPAFAGDDTHRYHIPEGVYIEMDSDFYQVIKDEGQRGTRTYTNDPKMLYLRQILVNQERILKLLQKLLDTKQK